MRDILLSIAIVSVICGVASAVMIGSMLQKRGIRINWIWYRLLLISKYLGQYRNITRQETGKVGPLFYIYVISMNLALAAAIAGLLLRAF